MKSAHNGNVNMLAYFISGNYSHATADTKMSQVYPVSVCYPWPTSYTLASVLLNIIIPQSTNLSSSIFTYVISIFTYAISEHQGQFGIKEKKSIEHVRKMCWFRNKRHCCVSGNFAEFLLPWCWSQTSVTARSYWCKC